MIQINDPVKVRCILCECSFELRADVLFSKDDLVCPNCGIDARGRFKPFVESFEAFVQKKGELSRIFEFDLGLRGHGNELLRGNGP